MRGIVPKKELIALDDVFTIPEKADDCGGFGLVQLILSPFYTIIYLIYYSLRNLAEYQWCWLPAYVGRGCNDGMPQALNQPLAKWIAHHTYGYGSVWRRYVFGEVAGFVVNNSNRFVDAVNQVFGNIRHSSNILRKGFEAVEQNYQAAAYRALLDAVHLVHRFTVERIATYSPNRIGGIKYHTSGLEYLNCLLYFGFKDCVHRVKSQSVVGQLCCKHI